MSVTVKRMPPQSLKKPTLAVVEHSDVWKKMTPVHNLEASEEPEDSIQKQPLPPQYMCPLCKDIFGNPFIAGCCGRSACFTCFQERAGNDCPFCTSAFSDVTKPIPNPRLADTVASLNLDYFELPKSKERLALQRHAEKEAMQMHRDAAEGDTGAEPVLLNPGALPTPWTTPSPCPSPFSWPPSSPASPPPSPGPGGPVGVALHPVAMTPEQFHLWQQLARDRSESSSSGSSRDRRRKSKKDKEKKKRSKKKQKHAEVSSEAVCGEMQISHRKTKKRRSH